MISKLTTYSYKKFSRQSPESVKNLSASIPCKPVKRGNHKFIKHSGYRKIVKIDRSHNVTNDLVDVPVDLDSFVSDLVWKKRPLDENKNVTAVGARKLPR